MVASGEASMRIIVVPMLLALISAALIGGGLYAIIRNQKTAEANAELVTIRQAFQAWKVINKKLYKAPAEETYRFENFVKSYQRVTQKNKSNISYKAGLTKFSDLSIEEFKFMYTGYKSNPIIPAPYDYSLLESKTTANDDGVDWRTTEGIVTPVKDQGQCGSCWAFSATGALEATAKLFTGQAYSFSEQQLVDCSGKYGNDGCDGGLMNAAFQYVMDNGITTEDAYPYTAKTDTCQSRSGIFKVKGFFNVPEKSNSALEHACDQQPVSVAVEADEWMDYESGVFDDKSCGKELDHGVLLVGYNDDYWIVKNSWGSDWGEKGYIRLKKSTIPERKGGICGILLGASIPKFN